MASHRLYDLEVIELNEDVSCILVLPPVESVCTVPGHHEEITQQPTSTLLPVQIFEMSEYYIGMLCFPKILNLMHLLEMSDVATMMWYTL